MPHERQVIGRGQARRAAADDGDLLVRGFRLLGNVHRTCGEHGMLLQPANVHGSVDHAAAARMLARMLAHERACARERIVIADDAHGVGGAAFAQARDVTGNVHMARAFLDARNSRERLRAHAVGQMAFGVFLDEVGKRQAHAASLEANRAIGRLVQRVAHHDDLLDDPLDMFAPKNRLEAVGQARQADAA